MSLIASSLLMARCWLLVLVLCAAGLWCHPALERDNTNTTSSSGSLVRASVKVEQKQDDLADADVPEMMTDFLRLATTTTPSVTPLKLARDTATTSLHNDTTSSTVATSTHASTKSMTTESPAMKLTSTQASTTTAPPFSVATSRFMPTTTTITTKRPVEDLEDSDDAEIVTFPSFKSAQQLNKVETTTTITTKMTDSPPVLSKVEAVASPANNKDIVDEPKPLKAPSPLKNDNKLSSTESLSSQKLEQPTKPAASNSTKNPQLVKLSTSVKATSGQKVALSSTTQTTEAAKEESQSTISPVQTVKQQKTMVLGQQGVRNPTKQQQMAANTTVPVQNQRNPAKSAASNQPRQQQQVLNQPAVFQQQQPPALMANPAVFGQQHRFAFNNNPAAFQQQFQMRPSFNSNGTIANQATMKGRPLFIRGGDGTPAQLIPISAWPQVVPMFNSNGVRLLQPQKIALPQSTVTASSS